MREAHASGWVVHSGQVISYTFCRRTGQRSVRLSPASPFPNKTSWNCRQRRDAVHCFTHLCAKEWKRPDRAALPTHMGRGKHLTPGSTGTVWMRVQSPWSSSQPHLDVFSPAGWPSCSDVRRKLWVTGKGFETSAKLNQLMGSVCHWQLSLSIKPVADIPGRPHTRHPPGLGYLECSEAQLYGCCRSPPSETSAIARVTNYIIDLSASCKDVLASDS